MKRPSKLPSSQAYAPVPTGDEEHDANNDRPFLPLPPAQTPALAGITRVRESLQQLTPWLPSTQSLVHAASARVRQSRQQSTRWLLPHKQAITSVAKLLAVAAPIVLFLLIIVFNTFDATAPHRLYAEMFTPAIAEFALYEWFLATFVIAVVPLNILFATLNNSSDNVDNSRTSIRTQRKELKLASAVYIVGLVCANGSAAIEIAMRSTSISENDFAARFNAFYCDVRAVRACLDSERELQQLVLRAAASDAALAEYSRCQHLLKWGIDESDGGENSTKRTTLSRLRVREGVAVIDTDKLYAFVNDYSSANAVGAWCDGVYSHKPTVSAADHHALPSPFAANPSAFARYVHESSLAMYKVNALFGAAIVCVALAIVGLTLAEVSA